MHQKCPLGKVADPTEWWGPVRAFPLAKEQGGPWWKGRQRTRSGCSRRAGSRYVSAASGLLSGADLAVGPAAVTRPDRSERGRQDHPACSTWSAALQAPTAGQVRFCGQDLGGKPALPHRRAQLGIARTFQRLELSSVRSPSARTCWRRPRGRRRWGGGSIVPAADAEDLLALVGLGHQADRRSDTLPTGQARLLELGRALATRPRLLLLDEPSSGLDEAESEELGHLLVRLADSGMGILLVEHDMDLVMAVCSQYLRARRLRRRAGGRAARGRARRLPGARRLSRDRGPGGRRPVGRSPACARLSSPPNAGPPIAGARRWWRCGGGARRLRPHRGAPRHRPLGRPRRGGGGPRPQRRRQVDRALKVASGLFSAPPGASWSWPAGRPTGCAPTSLWPGPACAPIPRGPGRLPHLDRGREPHRHDPRRHGPAPGRGAGLRPLPPPGRAAGARLQDPLGRRAADAGHGPGAVGGARRPLARRDLDGAGPQGGRRALRAGGRGGRPRGWPSC